MLAAASHLIHREQRRKPGFKLGKAGDEDYLGEQEHGEEDWSPDFELDKNVQQVDEISHGASLVADISRSATGEEQDEREESSSEQSAVDGTERGPSKGEHLNDSLMSSDDERPEQILDDADYNAEREYFSDPDFHDDRPGKRRADERVGLSQSSVSGSSLNVTAHQIYSETNSKEDCGRAQAKSGSAAESSDLMSEESVSDDETDEDKARASSEEKLSTPESSDKLARICASLGSSEIRYKDQADQGEHCSNLETFSSQLTASEAHAELFIGQEETTEGTKEFSLHDEEQDSGKSSNSAKYSDRKQNCYDNAIEEIIRTKVIENRNEYDTNHEQNNGNYEDKNDCRKSEPAGELAIRKWRLMDLVNDYCDKLVELIKDEALKQVELILASKKSAVTANKHAPIERLTTNFFESNSSNQVTRLHTNDDESRQPAADQQVLRTHCRRIYTSSLFYDDKQNSYPTIEEQLDRCQTIVKQLEMGIDEDKADTLNDEEKRESSEDLVGPKVTPLAEARMAPSQSDRANRMFRRRRERMRHYTIASPYGLADRQLDSASEQSTTSSSVGLRKTKSGSTLTASRCFEPDAGQDGASSDKEDDDEQASVMAGALTDTEYEAPQVAKWSKLTSSQSVNGHQRASHRGKMSSYQPKYKPFLDSTTLKDIKRLREWCPELEFNEHKSVSPKTCQMLVGGLKTSGGAEKKRMSRGAQLFERRMLQSSDWIVSNECNGRNGVDTLELESIQPRDSPSDEDLKNEHNDESSRANGVNQVSWPTIGDALSTNTGTTLFANDQLSRLRQAARLSRPSIAEETVMIAESACQEQLIELAPIVLSHQQPQFELATVTRTPSFSTSSRRIVECDSPDGNHLSSSPSTSSLEQSSEESRFDLDHDDRLGGAEERQAQRLGADCEKVVATYEQPRIQLNDHDLTEPSENGTTPEPPPSGGLMRKMVGPDELKQQTVELMDELTFGDNCDAVIGHKAVVISPSSSPVSSELSLRTSQDKVRLKCTIERLPEWPKVQFASMLYYGGGAEQPVASTGLQVQSTGLEDDDQAPNGAVDETQGSVEHSRIIDEEAAAGTIGALYGPRDILMNEQQEQDDGDQPERRGPLEGSDGRVPSEEDDKWRRQQRRRWPLEAPANSKRDCKCTCRLSPAAASYRIQDRWDNSNNPNSNWRRHDDLIHSESLAGGVFVVPESTYKGHTASNDVEGLSRIATGTRSVPTQQRRAPTPALCKHQHTPPSSSSSSSSRLLLWPPPPTDCEAIGQKMPPPRTSSDEPHRRLTCGHHAQAPQPPERLCQKHRLVETSVNGRSMMMNQSDCKPRGTTSQALTMATTNQRPPASHQMGVPVSFAPTGTAGQYKPMRLAATFTRDQFDQSAAGARWHDWRENEYASRQFDASVQRQNRLCHTITPTSDQQALASTSRSESLAGDRRQLQSCGMNELAPLGSNSSAGALGGQEELSGVCALRVCIRTLKEAHRIYIERRPTTLYHSEVTLL